MEVEIITHLKIKKTKDLLTVQHLQLKGLFLTHHLPTTPPHFSAISGIDMMEGMQMGISHPSQTPVCYLASLFISDPF